MRRLLRTYHRVGNGRLGARRAARREPASAATEIDWFVATPGYIRTDLLALGVASDPATGSLYVVSLTTANQFELLKLDVERLTVQARVPSVATAPAGYSGFVDVEVAPDGDRVYVVLPGKVISMRPTDLGGRTTVSIPGPVAAVADRGRARTITGVQIVWANDSDVCLACRRRDGDAVPSGGRTRWVVHVRGRMPTPCSTTWANMLRRFDISVGVDLVQETLTPLPTRSPEHDMMFVGRMAVVGLDQDRPRLARARRDRAAADPRRSRTTSCTSTVGSPCGGSTAP